jgi:hypothetical protein
LRANALTVSKQRHTGLEQQNPQALLGKLNGVLEKLW